MRVLLVLLLLVGVASAAPKQSLMPSFSTPKTAGSHAIGKATFGLLYNSVMIPFNGDALAFLPTHLKRKRNYTTQNMADLLGRTSQSLYESTGRRLILGDLSAQHGGWLTNHLSHQNGLDADVIFFYLDVDGDPVEPQMLIQLNDSGMDDSQKYYFDAAMTWRLVESLLTDEQEQVQYLILYGPLIQQVLTAGSLAGADPEILARAKTVLTEPPSNAEKHDDHIHIRLYCPKDPENLCEDTGPVWSWVTLQQKVEESKEK
jgi:penicillin-insensitive murein endopeptidase